MALRLLCAIASLLSFPGVLAVRDDMEFRLAVGEDSDVRAARDRGVSSDASSERSEPAEAEVEAMSAAAVRGRKSEAGRASAGAIAGGEATDVSVDAAEVVHPPEVMRYAPILHKTVVAHAKTHGGECPSEPAMSTVDLPGWDVAYRNGAGCHYLRNLCECNGQPFFNCATERRFFGGGKAEDGLTGDFVSAFGYCRVSTWALSMMCLLAVASVACASGLVYLAYCKLGDLAQRSRDLMGQAPGKPEPAEPPAPPASSPAHPAEVALDAPSPAPPAGQAAANPRTGHQEAQKHDKIDD